MATRKTNTRTAKFTSDTTVSQLTLAVANSLGVDQAQVAKKFRARVRSNFDTMSKTWKGLDEAKNNRDGNRYPPMPAALANAEFARMTAKKVADEA